MKDNSGSILRPRLLYVANEDFAFLQHRLPMARAARDAGFEVHVATRVGHGGPAIEAEGFCVHPIPFTRGGLSPFAALPTVLALRQIERTILPAIVHHSGLQSCVYGSIAAAGKAFAVVNAITGFGYVFTSRSLKTALLKPVIRKMLPVLLDRRRSVILVQNPDDAEAVRALGMRHAQIALIPGSGVDTEVLQPLPEPIGAVTIGFVGRLLVDKGIRALVAAHAIVRQQGHDVRLLIAGQPDPANPASVSLEEAQHWNQQPGIEWLGHIDDIAGLWRRCHVAALPSHREGLPMSLMEAAACGRPLIAVDAPGSREIVIPDRTGILVPIEDPPALAAAIIRLTTSPELRSRYAGAARDHVVSQLSATIVKEKIGKLYREIIAI